METTGTFASKGVHVVDRFLDPSACAELLTAIGRYRQNHELPVIYRRESERSLNYKVIDGDRIREHFPQLTSLYAAVNRLARDISSLDLVPLSNQTATVNVNVTPPAGEYRWHYDRNAVTAILFLNEVVGGEIEMYPNYRIYLGWKKHTRFQRWLDSLLRLKIILKRFGRKISLAPREGMLVIMRGDKCLHSVRAVESSNERLNIISKVAFILQLEG
jgi:hypothetical protein